MATRTGRRRWHDRIDEALRVGYLVQAGEREIRLLRAIHVTEGAIREIVGLALRCHAREANTRKIVMAASEANHDVWLSTIRGDVYAVVNAVHQQIKIDALRRLNFIRWICRAGAPGCIGIR